MSEDLYPVRWAGAQAVVVLPEHIGISNAGQIRAELLSLINRGATTLIADMTATISCDHAGLDAVTRVGQQAVTSGTELRLVVTAQIVSRMLSLGGLDRLVSSYPSMAAAEAAATAPAPVFALAATARTPAGGPMPSSRAGRPPARFPAATASDGTGGGMAPAMAEVLLDALQDGVALADDEGTLVLASPRLAEMFGYDDSELTGCPIESLVPAGPQAAHRSRRAALAQAPSTRPVDAGERLTGLRRDGTSFPVQISRTSVPATIGQFTLTVIRDSNRNRQLGDLGDLARGAFAADHGHLELFDKIINRLFHAGLSLQAAMDVSAGLAGQRIATALDDLDDTIREIRDTAFAARGHRTPPAGDTC